jgi:hypothetical protein
VNGPGRLRPAELRWFHSRRQLFIGRVPEVPGPKFALRFSILPTYLAERTCDLDGTTST